LEMTIHRWSIRLFLIFGLLEGSHGAATQLRCWNDSGALESCRGGCFSALNSKQQVKKGCISDIVNENAQVIATNVGHFDSVIMINKHPICIKICHEDKCNLNRPEGQCKPDQYQLDAASESKISKNTKNGQNQRMKRDIFLEYSSHDPITELLQKASDLGRAFQYRAKDMNHLSNSKLDAYKFNVRKPVDCETAFPKNDNLVQYKNCVKKNIYNHPSYISYSNFLQPTRRVRMTTQKILGNILKKRKGAHMDKIIFKKPKNEDGWKNCNDPCSTKCFHWIFDKKTPEEQWQHLITKHPYYFPYAYNPVTTKDPVTGVETTSLVKENERGNFNVSNVPLLDFFKTHRKYDEIKTLFDNAGMTGEEYNIDLYGRPTFTFGPEILTMYPRMAGDKTPFKVFKNYRFFSKLYDDVETVRRFAPEFWNMFPSAQNFSSNFSELYQNFKDDPSAWPDDILYKPFNPFWARPNDGNRNMVYGANVGPQASRNYAKRIQEVYNDFYSDTNLDDILGCEPLTKGKKDCIDISVSYPLSIGFHALGGYRNLNPGGFNAMDFVQGIRDNTRLKRMKYKFNGVKPLNKAVLANNDLVGAGSWVEFAPGLSQANEWKKAAGENAIETYKQPEKRVLPGFGVSNNPDFSSQGFHHSNFLSMSGSWVGRNHNIPQNKFNLLPDIHDRIGQMKFGQKGAPLQYTSLRSVISGSSASMDRRRDHHWIKDCKNFFQNQEN